jgi:hypothetical protein
MFVIFLIKFKFEFLYFNYVYTLTISWKIFEQYHFSLPKLVVQIKVHIISRT